MTRRELPGETLCCEMSYYRRGEPTTKRKEVLKDERRECQCLKEMFMDPEFTLRVADVQADRKTNRNDSNCYPCCVQMMCQSRNRVHAEFYVYRP